MADASTILARLRSDPALVDAGVDLLLDDALAQPLADALDPAALAPALAAAIRASAEAEGLEGWIARALGDLRGQIRPDQRPLRAHLPPALPKAIAGAVSHPITPGRELVRAAVNHATMRAMMRTVLQRTLYDFGKKMWSTLPDTSKIPGSGFRSRLMDMAKGVASVVGSEVERQLDDRVTTFVDGALASAIDIVIDRIADPAHADEMATWRADMVPAIVNQPQVRFVDELHKLPPEALAADALALLRAVAAWEELEAAIGRALASLLEVIGPRSLAEVAEGSGLVEAWRPLVRDRVAFHARRVITSEGFAAWIARVVDEGAPASD